MNSRLRNFGAALALSAGLVGCQTAKYSHSDVNRASSRIEKIADDTPLTDFSQPLRDLKQNTADLPYSNAKEITEVYNSGDLPSWSGTFYFAYPGEEETTVGTLDTKAALNNQILTLKRISDLYNVANKVTGENPETYALHFGSPNQDYLFTKSGGNELSKQDGVSRLEFLVPRGKNIGLEMRVEQLTAPSSLDKKHSYKISITPTIAGEVDLDLRKSRTDLSAYLEAATDTALASTLSSEAGLIVGIMHSGNLIGSGLESRSSSGSYFERVVVMGKKNFAQETIRNSISLGSNTVLISPILENNSYSGQMTVFGNNLVNPTLDSGTGTLTMEATRAQVNHYLRYLAGRGAFIGAAHIVKNNLGDKEPNSNSSSNSGYTGSGGRGGEGSGGGPVNPPADNGGRLGGSAGL